MSAAVSIYFRGDLLERIDAARGREARSSWIQRALEDALDGVGYTAQFPIIRSKAEGFCVEWPGPKPEPEETS